MRGKGTKVEQKNMQNVASIQGLTFDFTDVSKPEIREIYLRHIIAAFMEVKKLGGNENTKFVIDLSPEEVVLFEKARDHQGKRMFEKGGVVKNATLHIERHTFYCL